jgi:hypothetical protein
MTIDAGDIPMLPGSRNARHQTYESGLRNRSEPIERSGLPKSAPDHVSILESLIRSRKIPSPGAQIGIRIQDGRTWISKDYGGGLLSGWMLRTCLAR